MQQGPTHPSRASEAEYERARKKKCVEMRFRAGIVCILQAGCCSSHFQQTVWIFFICGISTRGSKIDENATTATRPSDLSVKKKRSEGEKIGGRGL